MKNYCLFTDKLAIGLSLLCLIHCLAFPVFIVMLPGMLASQLNDVAFHLWMLVAVVPISAYALTMGCRQHQRYSLIIFGVLGMIFLLLAVMLEEQFVNEYFSVEIIEKLFTVIGVNLLAYGHYLNYRLCQRVGVCGCSNIIV